MPFVHILDTVKVEILAHSVTTLQPIVNVIHASLADGSQTLANITNIAEAVSDAHAADVTQFGDEYYLDAVRATGLATATSPQWTEVSDKGASGTGASAPMNACAIVKLQSAFRGRSFRGRIYFSPLKQTYVSNGSFMTSGAQATFGVWFTDVQAALGASRKLGLSINATSGVCEPEMGSQRRRLVGR
jgi:hypothetical protein